MISAIVHTYNEEKNIKKCLQSLDFADEIVIVDMGSSDHTLKIAKTFHVNVFQHPYTQFVEPARNFAIGKTKHDWIFILDADEEVPHPLRTLLQKHAEENISDYLLIPRKNIIFGKWMKHTGWWPDYQVRFFKKGCVKWTEKIHGIPVTSGKGSEMEAKEENAILHHHYSTISQYIQRLNQYTSITAKEKLATYTENITTQILLSTTTGEFVKRFFLQEGYKDGLHGLALSTMQSFYELLVVLKIWELKGFHQKDIDLKNIETLFQDESKQKLYWQCETILKVSNSRLKKILWRIKRKLHIYG
jgi:(heptosyl)LPS beta-1,4-glucosyltransferase